MLCSKWLLTSGFLWLLLTSPESRGVFSGDIVSAFLPVWLLTKNFSDKESSINLHESLKIVSSIDNLPPLQPSIEIRLSGLERKTVKLPEAFHYRKRHHHDVDVRGILAQPLDWQHAVVSESNIQVLTSPDRSNYDAVAIPLLSQNEMGDIQPVWLVMSDRSTSIHPAPDLAGHSDICPDMRYLPLVDEIILDEEPDSPLLPSRYFTESDVREERQKVMYFHKIISNDFNHVVYQSNGVWYVVVYLGKLVFITPLWELQDYLSGLIFYALLYSGELPVYQAGRTQSQKTPVKSLPNDQAPAAKKRKLQKKFIPGKEESYRISKKGKGVQKKQSLEIANKPAPKGRPCPLCGKKIVLKMMKGWSRSMRGHILTEHRQLAVSCPVINCYQVFTGEQQYVEHVRQKKSCCPTPYQCRHEYCHQEISSRKRVRSHESNVCKGQQLPKLLTPGYQKAFNLFMSKHKMNNCMYRVQNSEKLLCTRCHSPDTRCHQTTRNALRHLSEVHGASGFACSTRSCLFILDSLTAWENHVQIIRSVAKKFDFYTHRENPFCHYFTGILTSMSDHKKNCRANIPETLPLKCLVSQCTVTCPSLTALESHCEQLRTSHSGDDTYEYVCDQPYCHWSMSKGYAARRNQDNQLVRRHKAWHQERNDKQLLFKPASRYLPDSYWNMAVFNEVLRLLHDSPEPVTSEISCLSGMIQLRTTLGATSVIEGEEPVADTTESIIELGCPPEQTMQLEQEIEFLRRQSGNGYSYRPEGNGKSLMVLKSQVQGLGVYAKQKIRSHHFIARFTGTIKSLIKGWQAMHCLSVQRQDDMWITIKPGKNNPLRYLNHSNQPNAVFHNNRRGELYALRDIVEGEEITIDYNWVEPESWDWTVMNAPEEGLSLLLADFELSAVIQDEYKRSANN